MENMNFKRLKALFASALMMVSSITTPVSYAGTFAESHNEFSDLRPDHWCYEKIIDFEEKGYVSGYPEGDFRPDATITRAEYVKIVNNFFGYASNTENKEIFSDVSTDDWFEPYVSEAVERGYISGYPDGTFRPDEPIRRQEATVILSKILNIHDEDYDDDHPDGLQQYSDGEETEEWAYKAVRNYSIYNFINGYEDGSLRILQNVTRAETVELLNILEEKIVIDRDDKSTEIKDKPQNSKQRVDTPVINVIESNINEDAWYNMIESENDGKVTVRVETNTVNANITVTVNGKVITTSKVTSTDKSIVEFELTDGIYDIKAQATKNGYKSSYEAKLKTVMVDTQKPVVSGIVNETEQTVDLYVDDNLSGVANDGIQYAWFVKDGEGYKRVKEWENISEKVPFLTEPQNYFIGVKGSDIAGNEIDGGLVDNNSDTGLTDADTNEPYDIVKEIKVNDEADKVQDEEDKPTSEEFSITYHKNDGSGKTYVQKLTENATTLKSGIFARDKYTFVGWSETSDGEVAYEDGATVNFIENKDLYAIWDLNESTTEEIEVNVKVELTFLAGENGTLVGDTNLKVVYGTKMNDITLPTPDANVGYKFDSWSPVLDETITTNKTYTAIFVKDDSQTKELSYTVEYYKDGIHVSEDDVVVKEIVWVNTEDILTVKPVDTLSNKYVGYTFKNTDPEIIPSVIVNGSIIKVNYEVNEHTIAFDTDGGSTIAPITQDYGTNITKPADPTKPGYTFIGWDKEIPSTMPDEDVTVKAIWEINEHTITFDTDGGSTIAPITQDYGTAVAKPADPTKPGYTFIGWDKEIPSVMPDEDIVVTAKWEVNEYTITFDTNGGSTIAPITQDYGTEVTKPADPTRPGYTFAGWDKEIPTTMPAENVIITAIWGVNEYIITFDTNGGSEIAPIVQDYGTKVTKPADPTRPGYTFAGWNKEIPTTMPAKNMTIKANWTINEYTITFDTNGGSTIAPITQDYGTKVTKPADPTKEGYTFKGWDKEIPTTMPAEDVTLTAKWEVNEYTITFDTNGGSKIDPITQDYGTEVTKPADPTRPGYTFAGWNKEIPTTMPAKDMTIKANWTINEYTITVDPNGGTWNGFTTEQTFVQEYNSKMDISKPESYDGYIITFDTNGGEEIDPIAQEMKFDYWDIVGEGTLNGTSFTIGLGDATLTAEYEAQEVELPTPVRPGYEFLGWYTNSELTGNKLMAGSYMPTASIILYANWLEKEPEFTVVKENNYPKNGKYAEEGTVITYTITVKNEGEKGETFTVVDDLTTKPLVDIKNISHGGVLTDGVITWNITIGAGKKVELEFEATVSDGIKPGETIENVASVSVRGHNEDTNKVTSTIEKSVVSKAIARVETVPDMNIVLALDLSSSMSAAFDGTTRLGAAKQAAATFITNLYENIDEGQNITVTLLGFNQLKNISKYYVNEMCAENHTHGDGCAVIDGIARKECTEEHDHIMSDTCYPFSDYNGAEIIVFNSEGEMQRTATRDNYEDLISEITNNVTYRWNTFLSPGIIRIDLELDRLEEKYPNADNVVIVLADGECADSDDLICTAVEKVENEHDAKFYSIAFGPAVNNPTYYGYKTLQKVSSNNTVYASNAIDELIGNFAEILESIKGTDYIQSTNGIINVTMNTINPYPIVIKYEDVNGIEEVITITDESQLVENNLSIVDNVLTVDISGDNYYKCTNLIITYNQEYDSSVDE